jgi:hypothetical protein
MKAAGASEPGDRNPLMEGSKSVALQRLRRPLWANANGLSPLVGAASMTQKEFGVSGS